ncbi:hypothetical protein KM043_009667 [Ampulex compressa]|nr:hypothetical protein KM043_009667 [Ampulex compressa]
MRFYVGTRRNESEGDLKAENYHSKPMRSVRADRKIRAAPRVKKPGSSRPVVFGLRNCGNPRKGIVGVAALPRPHVLLAKSKFLSLKGHEESGEEEGRRRGCTQGR